MAWKLGSLFDGSGGFPLAGVLCDIEPRWASEIEPYPIAVTRSRFPNMKHLGDISKLNGSELEPVDIITFGSPCQDLSVAGKRAGLKHEANGDEETTRSGLFMEAVRIIKEMKEATNGEYPRFALWENVPGAFSSNKGEDFRIVLEELVKIVEPTAVMPAVPKRGWPYSDSYVGDGWSIAYRVFDAQYWGVPQRRRRIHLVLDLRGECAREVLFEREGLRGHFTEGGTAWENLAAHAEGGLGAADPEGVHSRQRIYGDGRTPFTLKIRSGCEGGGKGPLIQTDKSATLATNNDQYLFQPIGINGDVTGTLDASYYKGCGMRQGTEREVVFQPIGADIYNLAVTGDVVGSLTAEGNTSTGSSPKVMIPEIYAVDQGGGKSGANFHHELSPTLTCTHGGEPVVCHPVPNILLDDQGGQQINVRTDDKCPTLRAEMHGNIPCVVEAAGFKAGQSAGTIGWQEECAATLAAECSGTEPTVCYKEQCLFENHSQDTRYKGPLDVCPMLPAQLGTGGNNTPFVVEQNVFCKSYRAKTADDATTWKEGVVANTLNTFDVGEVRANELVVESRPAYSLQGNTVDRDAKQNGCGVCENISHTLNAVDRHAVAYGIDHAITTGGNCTAQGPCVYEEVEATMKASGVHAVAYAMQSFGDYKESEVASGLKARDYKDATDLVADPAAYGVDCRNMNEYPELYPTMQAKPNGGQSLNFSGAVRTHYIVRRLTPTECARLQGFADLWGEIDEKETFSQEEYQFWMDVRNTHAAINGRAVKEYTEKQMLTWYNKLRTDSAEYKMWGNGIALPPALYCMQGIVGVLNRTTK